MLEADVIGGFPSVSENCLGCGNRLLLGNAWMTDGCPCNTALGVNSMNETRWRLLMQLQQMQSTECEMLKKAYEKQQLELMVWRHTVENAAAVLSETKRDLENVVCTKAPDDGVILLSAEGPTHFDPDTQCQVYDHDHFSPLGDALIAIHKNVSKTLTSQP